MALSPHFWSPLLPTNRYRPRRYLSMMQLLWHSSTTSGTTFPGSRGPQKGLPRHAYNLQQRTFFTPPSAFRISFSKQIGRSLGSSTEAPPLNGYRGSEGHIATRFLQPSFPGVQAGWFLPSYRWSQGPQPTSRGPFVQDGNPVLNNRCITHSGMYYQDSPERRFPPYSGTPQCEDLQHANPI